MDRKYILAGIELSAAAFALINCVGCSKSSSSPSRDTFGFTGVDFTLDLFSFTNSAPASGR